VQYDLNADLGEGFGPWQMGDDKALLSVVSSANIACGFHAGDPFIMEQTIRLAAERGVDIGAHVGFPDLQGFGRRPMQIASEELSAMVLYQLGALDGIARSLGRKVTHMSFHGALGNLAAADAAVAEPLVQTVARFDRTLRIVSSSSAAIEGAAARVGLQVVTTFLADRAYDAGGLLVPRSKPRSVIHDEVEALARVRRLMRQGVVETYDGGEIPMAAQSILLHGDTAGAVSLARAIRREIESGGGAIVPLSRLGI
jgi:UPF0271 protein